MFPIAFAACVNGASDDDDDDDDDDDSGYDIGTDSGQSGGDSGDSGGSGSGTGGDDGGTGGDDGSSPCLTEVAPGYPREGQSDFYYRSALDVSLSAPTGDEFMGLRDAAGAVVEGVSAHHDWSLSFTPNAPLDPDSAYTADVTTCDGTISYDFRTSGLGTALDNCSATAQAFQLDLRNARFVEPAGVAELLLGQVDSVPLIALTRASDEEGSLLLGAVADSAQDRCQPTNTLYGAWTNPHFAAGPEDVTFSVSEVDFPVAGFSVSADIQSDCSGLGGGVLAGVLDARDVGPLLGDLLGITDPDEVCTTLSGFGAPCGPCGDGEMYCVELLVEQVFGTALSVPVSTRSVSQVLADAECGGLSQACSTVPGPSGTPSLPGVLFPALGLFALARRPRQVVEA